MNTLPRPSSHPRTECGHVREAGATGCADQEAVMPELGKAASLRILDLMKRTGLPRTRVTAALDQLKRERVVQAFSMGSRYSVRASICPPATPSAHASTLADDTGAGKGHPCGGGLSAVGHT